MNRFFELKLPSRGTCIVLAMLAISLFGRVDAASAQQPANSAANRPVNVTAELSKSVVQVAEPFGLDVTVTAPAGTRVFFPAVNEQLGDFDIVGHQDVFDIPSTADPNGQRSWTRHFSLESIVTGDREIPPMEIRCVMGETSDSIATRALPIRVVSVLEDRADPTKFRDIKSVVDVELPQQKSNAWIFWTVGGLGAGVLSLATVALVARRKKFLTPSQWATGQLEALRDSPALQTADAESALQEMSDILRGYFELQFEISAPMQTTDEFVKLVEQGQIVDSPTAKRLAELLTMADQAKFAGLQLTQAELQEDIGSALGLIDIVTTKFASAQNHPSPDSPTQPIADMEATQ
jgi:hypothetical protein